MNTLLKRSIIDDILDHIEEPLPSVWRERGCKTIGAALTADRVLVF
jgi:hypothetical protein